MATAGSATSSFVHFRLLTGGSRTALPRQQTLRALVDWSIIAGTALKDQQRYLEAAAVLDEGVLLVRPTGHRWSTWRALSNFADAILILGSYELATGPLEESQVIARSIGMTYAVAQDRRKLGVIAHLRGDLERAAALLDDPLGRYRDLGATRGLDEGLNQLGCVRLARGNIERAAASFTESLRLCLSTGRHRSIVLNFEGLAGSPWRVRKAILPHGRRVRPGCSEPRHSIGRRSGFSRNRWSRQWSSLSRPPLAEIWEK